MAAIRVKPVEHRVQVQSVIPSRNEISKKAKKCLFGHPKPGETEKLFEKEQAINTQRLLNYKFVIKTTCRVNFDTGFNTGLRSSEDLKATKRSGSPLMTDHFKSTKKVCKINRSTSMTTKEKLSDVEECRTEAFPEIGSTNFVTNIETSESVLEADVICADEPLPSTHQHNQKQSQEEVSLHITVPDYAGKFC